MIALIVLLTVLVIAPCVAVWRVHWTRHERAYAPRHRPTRT